MRAERDTPKAPPGNGRVYHIFFKATDPFGGTCAGEVNVMVPLVLKGNAGDDGARYDSTLPAKR